MGMEPAQGGPASRGWSSASSLVHALTSSTILLPHECGSRRPRRPTSGRNTFIALATHMPDPRADSRPACEGGGPGGGGVLSPGGVHVPHTLSGPLPGPSYSPGPRYLRCCEGRTRFLHRTVGSAAWSTAGGEFVELRLLPPGGPRNRPASLAGLFLLTGTSTMGLLFPAAV